MKDILHFLLGLKMHDGVNNSDILTLFAAASNQFQIKLISEFQWRIVIWFIVRHGIRIGETMMHTADTTTVFFCTFLIQTNATSSNIQEIIRIPSNEEIVKLIELHFKIIRIDSKQAIIL